MSERPLRPVLAIGAVMFDDDGRVVLVQRGKAPLEGRWTLPGGSVELAEPIRAAVARETQEETGLVVEVGPLVEVYEHVSHGADGLLAFHYVILDYACRIMGGVLAAGSDARDAAFVAPADFDRYRVNDATRGVIARARAVDWSERNLATARLTPIVPGPS